MPEAWSAKDERQYEHIRDSYRERGVSKDEAEERAARTVNERRESRGETKQGNKSGKRADDRGPDNWAMTKEELYEQAKRYDISGRSKMDKEELQNAIAGHKGGTS